MLISPRVLLSATCLLVAPPSAFAAQVLSLSLDDMVDRADVVVWGKVVAVHAERMPAQPGRIHTLVTVAPTALVLGEAAAGDVAAQQIVMSVPGGVVGRFGQRVPGAPHIELGEEIVVLLQQNPVGDRIVIGLSQGLYRVRRPAGQAPQAVSDRAGLGLLLRAPDGTLRSAPASALLDQRPLSALLSAIRGRLKSRPQRTPEHGPRPGTLTP